MQLPYEKRYINSEEEIKEGENLLEFRLIYEGDLPPCTNAKRRPKEKHAIRRVFHPQLRRLWELKPNLRQLAEDLWVSSEERQNMDEKELEKLEGDKHDLSGAGLKYIGKQWNRAGYDLIPLVTQKFVLRCSLDVMLLRPGDKHFIFEQGDIDGQLKTLVDALRIPTTVEEAGGIGPQDGETPLFCLLENDNLVTEVHMVSDELLLLPHEKEVRANDAFVVIHVRLNHAHPGTFDRYFD